MALNLKTETVFTDDTAAAQAPLPPDQIAPHFPQLEILECLGRGGMGVVYKARQKTLNRLVALKLLAPERVGDAKFAERFTREAQALAALNHPNIVTIHDFGQAGGFYFLLMEFVDGLNLRQLLRMRKFTPEEALTIVPPLCDALQFAHDRGIVHRDIKPENILLDKTGRVKVADFGIAKMLGAGNGGATSSEAAAPASATQSTLGTPGYSAPEQKTDPQRVDSRADIYSLGVVFYELLTGELPGKPLQPPSKKVQIDVRLDEVVLRALEQKPELRYQQASVLKTEVETIVTTPPTAGSRGSAAATPPSDEAKAPAPPPADNLEEIRRQVTAPAIGLIVSSVLYGLFLIAVLFLCTTAELNFGGNGVPFPWWILVLMGFDIVAFAGALRMRRLRSHQLAVAGSVSAMLGLTLPFGIWAFVVLNRREVREAFGKGDREPPVNAPPMTAKSGRLRAALIVALVVWFFVAGTVTVITWVPPESWKVVAVISCPRKSQPGRPVDMDYFKHAATMIELIRSDVILGRVIDRLELDERSGKLDERWGKRNLGLKLTKAQAMVLLRWRLDVRASKGGTLIQVGVYGKRPEKWEEAMDIAAAIAQELRAFRIEQHDPPADMLEMTARATPPDILFGLAAGFVPGLLAGGLVLRWGFLRRGSQASQVKTAVDRASSPATSRQEPADASTAGKPWRANRKGLVFMIGVVMLGLLGTPAFIKYRREHTSAASLAERPWLLGAIPTDRVIHAGMAKPEQPWAWQELQQRAEAGKLSSSEAGLILDGLAAWLRRDYPNGYDRWLPWIGPLLKELHKRGLLSDAAALRFLEAYCLNPSCEPLPRLPETANTVRLTCRWRNPWHENLFGFVLLEEMLSITIDGQSVDWRNTFGKSWNRELFYGDLQLPELAPGKHTVKCEIESALIPQSDLTGVAQDATSADWPPAKRRWTRIAQADLLVYSQNAQIVGLTNDPALYPLAPDAPSATRVVLQRKGEGATATVVLPTSDKPPISFNLTLRIDGQDYACGSILSVPTRNGRTSGPNGASADVDSVDPKTKTAEIVLTPNSQAVERYSGVEWIWGSEIIFTNVPLTRYDLRGTNSAPGR
jgi:tRNA A-37 threonylcarbamoyl transferase component Bud32